MHPAAPPYRIRHLNGRAEYEMLGVQVMTWRRKRNLPAESARPILEALRDEREMAVLVDTHANAFVACLQLDRPRWPRRHGRISGTLSRHWGYPASLPLQAPSTGSTGS
ncbi:hypothetical protein [Streptomyces viridosporus]|uniref:hypothetical protein n=1 Tax=Streptomyces viridosporus TaxID=67581 RepID=UPI000304CF40|nr:hypothetical protein [Streptomyces viridosporus]